MACLIPPSSHYLGNPLNLRPTPPSPSAQSDKLLENLTKAITELAYSVNTMVISSLATDEDSRARVLGRIKEDKK
jgi:hypothetical protein